LAVSEKMDGKVLLIVILAQCQWDVAFIRARAVEGRGTCEG
jgi:hypothetical protein